MGRADFQAHLSAAQNGVFPNYGVLMQTGRDDGAFTLAYEYHRHQRVDIQIQTSDVGEYPRSHTFFIYTDTVDAPPAVISALQDLSILSELTIAQAVREIVKKLNHATETKSVEDDENDEEDDEDDTDEIDDDNPFKEDNFSDLEASDDGFCPLNDDDDDLFESGYGTTSPDSGQMLSRRPSALHEAASNHTERAKLAEILSNDIAIAKKAGFRVSHHGHGRLLMVSIRVVKLGIPDEALKAWHLQPFEYIMLVMKYNLGYQPFDTFKDSSNAKRFLNMQILVTKAHKLSMSEISDALDNTGKIDKENEVAEMVNDTEQTYRPLFIGTALGELLNTKLVTLMSSRLLHGFNWNGAISYYNERLGSLNNVDVDLDAYRLKEDISKTKNLPNFVLADHLGSAISTNDRTISLPCVAMQFTLRHVVRCTEFCLVCFASTEDSFEALKPYVCSRPLCLYQYMSMGLGPGIEFEVSTQKYVVDLLVSFCYHSASSFALRELPAGLNIMVPDPSVLPGYPPIPQDYSYAGPYATQPNIRSLPLQQSLVAAYQQASQMPVGILKDSGTPRKVEGIWIDKANELVFRDQNNPPQKENTADRRYQVGDWLTFWTPSKELYHCKVTETFHPTYRYQTLIKSRVNNLVDDWRWQGPSNVKVHVKQSRKDTGLEEGAVVVQIAPHNMLFDDLPKNAKQTALRAILDTLPGITEMAEWLSKGSKRQLAKWTQQIMPAALSILRWIIASNRSCIVYSGDDPDEELVSDMEGYLQFRFASGAPDKESRFMKNVQETRLRLKPIHPTIFAWHGSALKNWHSIIREGLDYKNVINGRAYGDGVYHALQVSVSMGYSQLVTPSSTWPASMLSIQQALSLNEIVNAPSEFRSAHPYLVVQNIDWIQTRFLFVKSSKIIETENSLPISRIDGIPMMQDQKYYPVNMKNQMLQIPAAAIHARRQFAPPSGQNEDYKLYKMSRQNELRPELRPELTEGNLITYVSDESDAEDRMITGVQETSSNLTSFLPGSLDRSKLPLFAPPSYATTMSSKALQREIKNMIKEQKDTPLQELGWYLDPEQLDNPYHWIVELHSFDKDLPLAKDMQSRKIDSIVLEIRFGPNFNFSPPFIRVIRPRFLPFIQGGGGHVTGGGALCMQLLTSDGWNPSATMSAVLLQVRMAITSLDPKPARLENNGAQQEYGVGEAIEAYTRACNAHGWKIPDDFKSMATMTAVVPTKDGDQKGPSKKQRLV